MKKKISIEEAMMQKQSKKVVDNLNKELRTADVKLDLSMVGYIKPPTHNFDFKHVLGKALNDDKVVILYRPERFRGEGKTTMISNAFYFKEDALIIVPSKAVAEMYYPYVPKNRVVEVEAIGRSKGRRHGAIILDEISLEEYHRIRPCIYGMSEKISGVVSQHKDYEIL